MSYYEVRGSGGQVMATLAFYTGMRWGEIQKLRWRNIDLLNRKVRLDAGTTKNDEAHLIPLPGELPEMLSIERAR